MTDQAERVAFTWRLTPDQADQVDTLVLRLRRQLGRTRLTKAEVLWALGPVAKVDLGGWMIMAWGVVI